MNLLLVLAGVCLLYLGGEGLVRGATSAGRRLGLSPMVIGLTIVSMGTSSPELAATLAGVLQGAPAVAFGNVVGSNISNLGLVLGVTALIWPLDVAARFIRRDGPFMIAVSALIYLVVWNSVIGRSEGIALLVILTLFLGSLLRRPSEALEIETEFKEAFGQPTLSPWVSITAIVVGIGLLVIGAKILIIGAVGLATTLGISERVIGLTLVALGTSLPELASSVVAAIHREGDVVIGNLIGSNIFNILLILGMTAVVSPIPVDAQSIWIDLHVMMGISILAWFFLRSQSHLGRLEGALLIVAYAAYIGFLFT
jgi:cation:H+ antiporter